MSVSYRSYNQEDQDAYKRLLNQIYNAPLGDELFQSFEQSFQQCTLFKRFLFEVDTQVVGVLEYYHMPWTSGENTIQARLIVDRAHRRKGYGKLLQQAFMEDLETLSSFKTVGVMVRDSDEDSYEWVQRRGFERYAHQFESSLDLTSWTPERIDTELQHAENHGLTFQTLDDLILDESTIKKLYEFMTPMLQDTPDNSGSAQIMPFAVFEMYVHTLNPQLVFLAKRNEDWAGLTTLTVENEQLYTVFTGTSRTHRGHTISYYLKLYSIKTAKALGYSRIRTNNQSDNSPMLAINQKLGYIREPGNYRLSKRLDS